MDDQAFTGDGAHQVVELALNRWQVREDVCVIELKVIEDRGARAVVNKF